jgi:DNA-directed RNA polymerase specialized sigma subunit
MVTPTVQQKVLEMRLNHLTHEEIAGIIGVSYQAVQQLEKKAIQSITGGAA